MPVDTKRPAKVSDTYCVRVLEIADCKHELQAFWAGMDNEAPSEQSKTDRFYLTNPVGGGVAFCIEFLPEKRFVGVICVAPRQFRVGEHLLTAGLLTDSFIEPAHRSLGPALMLQKAVIGGSLSRFEVIYGFTNDTSSHMRRFSGLKVDRTVEEFVLPIDLKHYLASRDSSRLLSMAGSMVANAAPSLLKLSTLGTRGGYRESDVDDQFIDELGRSFHDRRSGYGVRDASFYRWKIPSLNWGEPTFFGLVDNRGKAAGLMVYARNRFGGIQVLDFVAVDDDVMKAMLGGIVRKCLHAKNRSIAIHVSSTQTSVRKLVRRFGFRLRGKLECFVSLGSSSQYDADISAIHVTRIDNDS